MTLNPAARAAAVAFLTAFVTLFMQVLVHRMVSAKLLNNYAFLVISLTMLGFAFSGALLSRMLPRVLRNLGDSITSSAAFFAVTTVVASAIFYQADIGSHGASSRLEFVLTLLRWIPISLLYAIPFTFCGFILGALLSSPDLPTRRIYCFDLVGSALGALVAIPAIKLLGVEYSVLAACGALLLGVYLLTPPVGRVPRAFAGAAACILVLSLVYCDRLFQLYFPEGSMLAASRHKESGVVVEHIEWDPLARVELSQIPPPDPQTTLFPSFLGENRAFLSKFKRMITQNNYAFTYAVDFDGRAESLKGIEETIHSAAYHASSVPRPRCLVIGVGGGYDILNALAFNASDITGVEINGANVNLLTTTYRDYFREWVEDPRVQLKWDEGRHFLETTSQRFDVIQLSEVGTYSGTPGAAHVFTENHLYSSEAFSLYLSRMTDGGILNVMRLEFPHPRIMLRALTTVVDALRRAGVKQPADHIMMLTQTNWRFTALLVKKTPFTDAEEQRLQAWASQRNFFFLSAAPRLNHQRANVYQLFLSLADQQKEEAFLNLYPLDVSPVDDDRPFFFRFSYWSHLFTSDPMIQRHVIPIMEYSVVLLTLIIGVAAFLCVYVPLRHLTFQGFRTHHAPRYTLFFAGTGLAYMAIEIALLQKFGLFLGHPNYALSVVLASFLLSTGLGALFSETFVKALGKLRYVSYVLAAVILVEYGMILGHLHDLIALPFWLRACIVFILVLPIGACLGTFVPSALEQLKLSASRFVPWAWGINGIFSVLGPVFSVGLSITWGINALLLSAIPVYLAVGFLLPDNERVLQVSSQTVSPETMDRIGESSSQSQVV